MDRIPIPAEVKAVLTEDARVVIERYRKMEDDMLRNPKELVLPLVENDINLKLPYYIEALSDVEIRKPVLHKVIDYYHLRRIDFGVLVHGFKLVYNNNFRAEPVTYRCLLGYVVLEKKGIINKKLDLYADETVTPFCYPDYHRSLRWDIMSVALYRKRINEYVAEVKKKICLDS